MTKNRLRRALARKHFFLIDITLNSKQEVDMQRESTKSDSLARQLEVALRAYVFDQMPIRLLELPGMRLIEREEIIMHISNRLAHLKREKIIQFMLDTVDTLSKEENFHIDNDLEEEENPQNDNDLEEDVREDPLKAIFRILFSEYGGYAILSHTWFHGRDSEIKYQDALVEEWQLRYTDSDPGYRKIKEFCNVAHEMGVSLAWADTICINKDSSAELDESIRSMYRWYQDSSICITYLHETSAMDSRDVSTESTSTTPDPQASSHKDPLLNSMNKDGWFTRGWTLQELLAPMRLKFYDCSWKAICPGANDKDDLDIRSRVSMVTGISSQDLVSFDPLKTTTTVIERMVWATKRNTTRGEDRAYSLMGIFGVSIPTSYGEGAERAFFRLVEAIITSRHISQIIQVLAWGGKPVSDRIHPSRLIPSSPECYLHSPIVLDNTNKLTSDDIFDELTSDDIAQACQMFPLTGEAMILTHLGLRVRLLLVRSHPSKLSTSGSSKTERGTEVGPWRVKLTCTGPSFDHQTPEIVKINLKKMHPSYRPSEDDFASICETGGPHEFVFGIFTFSEDKKYVVIPPRCFAFLLAIPTSKDKFSMESLTSDTFEPNWKIDTHEIIHIRGGKNPNNIRVKMAKHRDTMKVMTVNL